MRIVSRKPLKDFSRKHPVAKTPLDAWYQEAKAAEWRSFADIKGLYGSADVVAGNRVIFNIGGNKYRLVVKIAYRTGAAYIKFIGTHKEYDKIDPTTIELK
jgi:mRNA interferase HigB